MPTELLDLTLPLTTAARAGIASFVVDAPKLTTAAVLAVHAGDATRVASVARQLHSLSDPIGATQVATMALLLERAADAGRLDKVPDDHGLGYAMAGAVRACRELLEA